MANRNLKHIKYIYKGEMKDDDTPAVRKEIVEAFNKFPEDCSKLRKFFAERDGLDGSIIYVLWIELPKVKNGDDEIVLLRCDNNFIEKITISQQQMRGIDALSRAFISEVTAEEI